MKQVAPLYAETSGEVRDGLMFFCRRSMDFEVLSDLELASPSFSEFSFQPQPQSQNFYDS